MIHAFVVVGRETIDFTESQGLRRPCSCTSRVSSAISVDLALFLTNLSCRVGFSVRSSNDWVYRILERSKISARVSTDDFERAPGDSAEAGLTVSSLSEPSVLNPALS